MTFSLEGREVVDTINRTLITILIFWVIHQIIEPISYILSGLDKLLTRELIGWIIKSLKILIFILGLAAVLELWGIKKRSNHCRSWIVWCCCSIRGTRFI
ncbi:MAG: hypothetical protein CM1200mP13_00560 [Candidatus Pelagibacterales bacterium]|nr:MAG: hypothetical protein CM1200mP13_00560 [Pelagibacterales bacterium]